ncbi:hypothetical protein [Streptomyces sp. NPDC020141]|uniref:hypothetical protein n=1 Tax=Streptomyces sp. NPDC020141 TaxID=3365065 RepID=UPI00378AC50A
MDGERKTNASFWRAGTRVLPKAEAPVRRSAYRPGWQRAASRITGLGAVGSAGYWALGEGERRDTTLTTVRGLLDDPAPLAAAAQTGGITAVSAAAVGGTVYGLATRRRREFQREWVTPLREALAVPLGISELTDPRRYLHVPRDFSDDDAQIRIDVPTHMRFNEDLVADLVVKKLALENVSFTWRRAGRNTHVVAKKRKAPPTPKVAARSPTSWTSSGSPTPGPAVCPASPTAATSPRSTTPWSTSLRKAGVDSPTPSSWPTTSSKRSPGASAPGS